MLYVRCSTSVLFQPLRGFYERINVYAITGPTLSPFYILALLNSKTMTDIYRSKFESKHLRGGYLAINKKQLERLPIPVPAPGVESAVSSRLAHQVIEKLEALHIDEIDKYASEMAETRLLSDINGMVATGIRRNAFIELLDLLARRMQQLNATLQDADHDRSETRTRIHHIDTLIDRIVVDLYRLATEVVHT